MSLKDRAVAIRHGDFASVKDLLVDLADAVDSLLTIVSDDAEIESTGEDEN